MQSKHSGSIFVIMVSLFSLIFMEGCEKAQQSIDPTSEAIAKLLSKLGRVGAYYGYAANSMDTVKKTGKFFEENFKGKTPPANFETLLEGIKEIDGWTERPRSIEIVIWGGGDPLTPVDLESILGKNYVTETTKTEIPGSGGREQVLGGFKSTLNRKWSKACE